MTTKRLLSACYQAIDDMVFTSAESLPELNRRYEAAFATYATAARTSAPSVATDRCEHCYEWVAIATLAPLETDYTSNQAALDYSLERDDRLCTRCRCELEETYGRWPDDGPEFEHVADR